MGFLIHRKLLCIEFSIPSLPLSPKAIPASPAVNIFLAALISLSSVFLQEGHSQILSFNFNSLLICPHELHFLEEGNQRSISKSSLAYQSALYLSFLKKSPRLVSAMDLASFLFFHRPLTLRFSTATTLVFAY